MKTLVCLLILMGTMCAQEKRSEPYRMNNDVLGESLEEFRHNNPKCVVQDALKGMVKGPAVRRLGCMPEINGETPSEPDTNWEPDTDYDGIPLWTRRALFNGEDGMVGLSFAFRSADAVRLEEQFLRDVGPPSTPVPIWENGTSAIILQAKVEDSKYGILVLIQEKFMGQIAELAKAKIQQMEQLRGIAKTLPERTGQNLAETNTTLFMRLAQAKQTGTPEFAATREFLITHFGEVSPEHIDVLLRSMESI